MITVKSNINEFLKNYKKKINSLAKVLNSLATRLAKKMSDDMLQEIKKAKSKWNEPQSFLDTLQIDENIFSITISNNVARVSIGNNLPLRELGNTAYSISSKAQKPTYVNPMYFIEFGFGVIGQKKPSPHSNKYNWEYNINKHGQLTEAPWKYYDEMIDLQSSSGKEGINFLYNTIQNYRTHWKQYLKELITEIGNG